MTMPMLIAALLFVGDVFAFNVRSSVKNEAGEPVEDAVVYAINLNGDAPASGPRYEIMDQRDKEFVPYVLPVQVGTAVYFPNEDNIRHQVYSISSTKKFQLPLYKGTPAEPVVFERPGAVALGCNIHDWMIAYIYVVETPWFAKTGEDGKAELRELPQGAYEVRVWHPRMKATAESTGKRIDAAGQAEANVDFRITFRITEKPEFRPPRAPAMEGDEYR